MQGSITVFLDYEQEGNFLKINIKDTGIGIKVEDRKKLFTLFGKLEDTALINTSGIGLGLCICMKIVEAF